jgi:hypothetical protein
VVVVGDVKAGADTAVPGVLVYVKRTVPPLFELHIHVISTQEPRLVGGGGSPRSSLEARLVSLVSRERQAVFLHNPTGSTTPTQVLRVSENRPPAFCPLKGVRQRCMSTVWDRLPESP